MELEYLFILNYNGTKLFISFNGRDVWTEVRKFIYFLGGVGQNIHYQLFLDHKVSNGRPRTLHADDETIGVRQKKIVTFYFNYMRKRMNFEIHQKDRVNKYNKYVIYQDN